MRLIPLLLLTACAAAGCSGKSASDRTATGLSPSPTYSEETMRLPVIPGHISRSDERVAYAAAHFWDSLDFSRDARALDTAFMEQNFANFITVAAYAAEEEAQKAVDRLLDRASVSHSTRDLIDHIAAKYLDDPNSPLRSEELYVMFLRHMAADSMSGDAKKARAQFRLEQAMKNRVGSVASDLCITTGDGKETSLLKLVGNDTTLIMFYDPSCEQCDALISYLDNTRIDRRFKVIAVDVADDRQLREKTGSAMPAGWITTFATKAIDLEEKYYLPALPSLYLIAPDGTVILKDIPPTAF